MSSSEFTLLLTLADLTKELNAWRRCVAPEKIPKNASLSKFGASFRQMLHLSSRGRDKRKDNLKF
jgi:hypothetical protein